jgi:hypothetical protein
LGVEPHQGGRFGDHPKGTQERVDSHIIQHTGTNSITCIAEFKQKYRKDLTCGDNPSPRCAPDLMRSVKKVIETSSSVLMRALSMRQLFVDRSGVL